jgi:hypothetical protein
MAPAVPETVLRKRKRDEQWAAKKAAAAAEVCLAVSWLMRYRKSINYTQSYAYMHSIWCGMVEKTDMRGTWGLAAKPSLMPLQTMILIHAWLRMGILIILLYVVGYIQVQISTQGDFQKSREVCRRVQTAGG